MRTLEYQKCYKNEQEQLNIYNRLAEERNNPAWEDAVQLNTANIINSLPTEEGGKIEVSNGLIKFTIAAQKIESGIIYVGYIQKYNNSYPATQEEMAHIAPVLAKNHFRAINC